MRNSETNKASNSHELDTFAWQACLSELSLFNQNQATCQRMFETLVAKHAEPHRAYHNATHIQACLQWVSDIQHLLKQPNWVRIAFYFHDAIYDTLPSNKNHTDKRSNEEKSAQLARQFLESINAPVELTNWVESAILATQSHKKNDDNDTAFLLDIDISILGQSEEVYTRYSEAIREEYRYIDTSTFRTGRTSVLSHFLKAPRLFQTQYFFERLEAQARLNLQNEIQLLKQ